MLISRRFLTQLSMAFFSLSALPAFAGPEEDAVAGKLEEFRSAQATLNAATLTSLSAPELSYSHSDGRVEDRATFVTNATSGRSTFLSLAYRNPTINIVGNTAIVRFNWVAEQQAASNGAKTATNLHILMVWHKQAAEWKLLARSSTRL